MTLTREEIVKAALELSPSDLDAVIQDLLVGGDPEERKAMDAIWLAESNRRFEDYVSGKTPGHSFESVKAELMARARR